VLVSGSGWLVVEGGLVYRCVCGWGAHNIALLKVLTFPKRCFKPRVRVEISVMYCAGVTTDDVVFAVAVTVGECILNLV